MVLMLVVNLSNIIGRQYCMIITYLKTGEGEDVEYCCPRAECNVASLSEYMKEKGFQFQVLRVSLGVF